MKIKTYLLSLIIIGSLNCKKYCPDDVHFGEVQLMPESIDIFPYVDKTMAEFVNSENDTIKFELRNFERINEGDIYLGNLCIEKETRSDLLANSRRIVGSLSSLDEVNFDRVGRISIIHSVINLNKDNPRDTILVDNIEIRSNLFIENPSPTQNPLHHYFDVISNSRGNNNISNLMLTSHGTFNEQVELNNIPFQNIYKSNFGNVIYYSLEQGIVGFEDKKELWALSKLY